MTFLEFCQGYFPKENLFYEMEGLLVVNLQRMFGLEYSRIQSDLAAEDRVRPTDIVCAVVPWADMYHRPDWEGPEELFLSEEETRLMKQLQIVIDPEVAGIDLGFLAHDFRMRGRPVTEEQAFDIIRRTDMFFSLDLDKYDLENRVGEPYIPFLMNEWFDHNRGWVRPDGAIGMNSSIWKYAKESEIVHTMLPLMSAFPYLDLMIGIADWNAYPFCEEDFEEHIIYGIWLHDGALELMAPARAREKYAEYRRLYSGTDESIFTFSYYSDNHIHPADFEYLKRCIRSHGLDPVVGLLGRRYAL